jgi:type VI secretion system protein ImpH
VAGEAGRSAQPVTAPSQPLGPSGDAVRGVGEGLGEGDGDGEGGIDDGTRLDRDGAAGAEPARGELPGARERYQARQQLLDELEREPHRFDFFQIMRRLESLSPEQPRFATAPRPADESIRLGQEPSMSFAPAALAVLRRGRGGGRRARAAGIMRPVGVGGGGRGAAVPRLSVNFFGLLGPNGPLPLHLTEYTRDRLRNADDPTMSRFFDLFHHRLLLMFYRAWANGQPTVNHDRPESDRFVTYVGALLGIAPPALRNRDDFPDAAKLYYAGRFSSQSRNAEGLADILRDFLNMPARIESFVGDWLALSPVDRWTLGRQPPQGGLLGISTTLGARAFGRQQKFRVVLGPLNRRQFQRMLPGGAGLRRLVSCVRQYAGDELRWDVRLFLDKKTEEPLTLGHSNLGWTSWLGKAVGPGRDDLLLTPELESTGAAA